MPAQRVDWVDMPFVGEPYRDSGYGRSLADLMQRRGQQSAQMHLARGDAAAQMWMRAGDVIGNAVQGWQRSAQENRDRELAYAREARNAEAQGIQIEAAKGALAKQQRADKGEALTRQLLPLARRGDGVVGYDRDILQREYEAAGMGDMIPGVFAELDKMDAEHLKVIEARRDAAAGGALRVLQGGASAEAYEAMLELWGENDLVPARELDILRNAGTTPEARQQALLATVQSSSKFSGVLKQMQDAQRPDLMSVDPQNTIIDKRNGRVVHEGQPKTPASIEAAILQETDPAKREELFGLREQFARAGLAPVQPPSVQAKSLVNDQGKEVEGYFDPATRRYYDAQGAVITNPTSPRQRDQSAAADLRKFETAGPIIDSIADLSERINTLQGVLATASGKIEKEKAKVNLNDDVAEYESIVSGFTPLVARAMGHTGVLTEQDVQSVKALFPRPEDSKALRDRKMARIKTIVGRLKEISGAPVEPGATGQAGAAPKTIGRFKVEPE